MYVWELVLLSILFVFANLSILLFMDTEKDKGMYCISVVVTVALVTIQNFLYWDKEIQNVIGEICIYVIAGVFAFSLAGGEKKNPRIGRIVLVESLAIVILVAITCQHFDKKVISDRSFVARNKIFLEYNYDSEEQGIAQSADLLKRAGKTDDEIIKILIRYFGLNYNDAEAYIR